MNSPIEQRRNINYDLNTGFFESIEACNQFTIDDSQLDKYFLETTDNDSNLSSFNRDESETKSSNHSVPQSPVATNYLQSISNESSNKSALTCKGIASYLFKPLTSKLLKKLKTKSEPREANVPSKSTSCQVIVNSNYSKNINLTHLCDSNYHNASDPFFTYGDFVLYKI